VPVDRTQGRPRFFPLGWRDHACLSPRRAYGLVARFILAVAACLVASAPASGQPHSGSGRVVAVDPAGGSIVLDHDAIPDLMPAMRMQFAAAPELLQKVRVGDTVRFLDLHFWLAVDGGEDWVEESTEFRQLCDRLFRTVDRGEQESLIRQMERHASEQAYFLFQYQPIDLVAVKKNVTYVPDPTFLVLAQTAVVGPGQ